MENRCEVIRTNQRLNAENAWRLYNQCAVVEGVIDGLKNDLSATGIPSRQILAQARALYRRADRL